MSQNDNHVMYGFFIIKGHTMYWVYLRFKQRKVALITKLEIFGDPIMKEASYIYPLKQNKDTEWI